MKEPPFADSIWGVRLQTLWIFFAVLYSAAASFAPKRIISSLMILLAGVLLLAVFAHIIISPDLDRIRRTLLVVLAASIFLVNTALNAFKDNLAAVFAGLFALMLGALIWRSRMDQQFRWLQYLCFTSMSLALTSAALGLIATISIKELIYRGWVRADFYVFAPMDTATMCGFSVGTLLNARIVSNKVKGYVSIPPAKLSMLVMGACALSVVSGVVLTLANRMRIERYIGSLARGGLFATFYAFCFILPIVLYLARVHKSSGDPPLFSLRTFGCLVLVALTSSIPADVVVCFATHSGTFLRRWFGAEAVVGIFVGLGIGIGFWCVNLLSQTVMAVSLEQTTE